MSDSSITRTGGTAAVHRMIGEWIRARAELEEFERAENPDITDRFGRVWVWESKDLYAHRPCGLAWTRDMVESGNFGLPTVHYPNMCGICCGGHDHATTDEDWHIPPSSGRSDDGTWHDCTCARDTPCGKVSTLILDPRCPSHGANGVHGAFRAHRASECPRRTTEDGRADR